MKLSFLESRRMAAVLLLLGAWLPLSLSWAQEKLYLKSGEMFEGTVLEDTAAGVKMQVRTGTIKETKSFARDQVDRIERPKPDDLALQVLQGKLPAPSLLDVAGYKRLIDPAEQFLKDFPDSAHRETVQKMVDELKAESQKVATGALKLNGEWISADERKAHQENVDADILLARAQLLARSGNYLAALRGLDALRTQYPKTRAYANSIAMSGEVMKAYGRYLQQTAQDRKNYLVSLEERKARMTDAERRVVENEALQRQAQVDSLNVKEKAAGVKWRTINLDNPKSVEDEIAFVRKELTALEKVKVDDLKLDSEALYQAESLLAQGQFDAAEVKLREAMRTKSRLLASKDPHIARVIRALVETREAQAKAAKLAEIEKAKLAANVKPLATGPEDGKEASAEEALDALMAERPAKKAGEEGKSGTAAKTGSASKSKSSSKAKAGEEDAEEEGEDSASGKARKERPAAQASSGGPGFPVIMGGVFALLLVATGVIFYVDKKKKAAAGGEGGGEE